MRFKKRKKNAQFEAVTITLRGTQVLSSDAGVSLSAALSIVFLAMSARHLQIIASDSPEAPLDLFCVRFLL